ncbi:SDR family oxidoreductase [Streptomyces sp. I05A-00742]|uniref:SDR family oxidoreductase n=1 Tax=Streptomyces sp. I05A-00742 TaxID=2732853 RepID=UPI00148761A7|nr:SDR family oxidoreductase [Streptomyces sp. I05A-00742]
MSRSVVVTGATSGIGRATALRLARAGYEVFATARDEEKAGKLRAHAEERGVRLHVPVLDVTDATACRDVLADIAERTDGGPWAVVNNAGVTVPRAVEDVDEAEARQGLEVNLLAPARIARLVLPAMRRRGGGRIVNVSSAAGRAVLPFTGWYSAGKAGLNALTEALRMEAAPFGVDVVLVEPGFHASPLLEQAARALERPSTVSPRYGDCYRAAAAALRTPGRHPGPERAAAVVHRALTAPRPRARYGVGADVRLAALLDAVTPAVVRDPVKRAVAGLDEVPLGCDRLLTRWCGLPRL